jgi:hypothetical protein
MDCDEELPRDSISSLIAIVRSSLEPSLSILESFDVPDEVEIKVEAVCC